MGLSIIDQCGANTCVPVTGSLGGIRSPGTRYSSRGWVAGLAGEDENDEVELAARAGDYLASPPVPRLVVSTPARRARCSLASCPSSQGARGRAGWAGP